MHLEVVLAKSQLKNPNKHITVPGRFFAAKAVGVLAAILVGLTLAWSFVYCELTKYQMGIVPTYEHGPPPVFWDYLYFSAVTISTLGYGDYRPVSFGRLAAAAEVIAGLVAFGVFVAQLTSARQERLVVRLARAQISEKLQYFRKRINTHAIELDHILSCDLRLNFQPHEKAKLLEITGHTPQAVLGEMAIVVHGLARHLRWEVAQGDFFEIAPAPSMGRIAGTLHFVLVLLSQVPIQRLVAQLPHAERHALTRQVNTVREDCIAIAESIRRLNSASLRHSADTILAAAKILAQSHDYAILKTAPS
jgi:hypothetical protein